MKTKLVFHFYLTPKNIVSEINKIHFKCLEHYINVFDDCLFVISLDDIKDYNFIKQIEKKLLDINKNGNISFKIHQNDEFRESSTFKTEIIDKLNENELVFFAHNKGTTNEEFNQEIIKTWIMGMYFYNLNFMEEVKYYLLSCNFISHGAFLTVIENWFKTKYKWQYAGTFFWINSLSLLNRINQFNVKIPELDNRFYSEDFLSNVFPSWPEPLAASHELRFFKETPNFYKDDKLIEKFYTDKALFMDFMASITKA